MAPTFFRPVGTSSPPSRMTTRVLSLFTLEVMDPRPHVGVAAQDGVPHVVVMGGLDVVKEDHVLQLHGVAHHGLLAHDGAAPDEGAVADLRLVVDDAGAADVGGGEHLGVLGDPHVLGGGWSNSSGGRVGPRRRM